MNLSRYKEQNRKRKIYVGEKGGGKRLFPFIYKELFSPPIPNSYKLFSTPWKKRKFPVGKEVKSSCFTPGGKELCFSSFLPALHSSSSSDFSVTYPFSSRSRSGQASTQFFVVLRLSPRSAAIAPIRTEPFLLSFA